MGEKEAENTAEDKGEDQKCLQHMTLHNNSIELAERNVENWLKYMCIKYEGERNNIDREVRDKI